MKPLDVRPVRAMSALPDSARALSGAALALWALLAGAASVLVSGYAFGQNNNVFHLPIVARLYALPAFAADPFVQSLRSFASGWWMALEGSDRLLPARELFLPLLVLSRALTMGAAWLVATELGLGLKGWREAAGFMALLSISPLLAGAAYAGHGGLFIPYFTHSEVANGLTLLVWWAMCRARLDLALVLAGAVAFVNLFMGVWLAVPLLAWALWRIATADATACAQTLRQGTIGLLMAALVVTPVLVRVLGAEQVAALTGQGEVAGAYAAFLRSYFPYHYFADAITAGQALGLLCVLAIGALLLRRLPRGHALAFAWGGSVAVYAMGMVLPAFTDARWALNLHLLRVSVHFHLVAAVGLAALTVQAVRDARRSGRWGLAAWLVLTGATVRALLPLALLALSRRGAAWLARQPALGRGVGVAALCVALAGAVAGSVHRQLESAGQRADIQQWSALAQGIRAATSDQDILLLPLGPGPGEPPQFGPDIMEYIAQRPVWVDHKRGAAAMWSPAYLPIWRQRTTEVAALQTWPQRLDYARSQGLAVVVDRCEPAALPADGALLAQAGPWCAVRVPVTPGRAGS